MILLQRKIIFPIVDFPVYCRIFEDIAVAYTENCKDVVQCIQYMNGTPQSEVSTTTNYLIASDVTSSVYQMAVRRAISVVQPEWIHRCWQQKTLFDPQKYLLPPFSGCVITVTGLSEVSRNRIEQLTSLYGGIFSSDATVECTHLISERPVGLKYRFAKTKGIKVVTPDWFYDSLKMNACVDVRNYDVSIPTARYFPSIKEDKPTITRSFRFNMNSVDVAFRLIEIISQKLMTINTVCELLETSTIRKQTLLRENSLKFISEHYEEIIKTEHFSKLSEELQAEILAINSTTTTTTATTTRTEEELSESEPQPKKRKADSP